MSVHDDSSHLTTQSLRSRISPSSAAILLLKFYRYGLSPLLPQSCRFAPTCSVYAIESIREFGLWKGSVLGLKRITRCHPFTRGGYDPVPAKASEAGWFRTRTE